MQIIKDALLKEAKSWIGPDDTFSDWSRHCMIDPSNELVVAYQAGDMGDGGADDDEEYEDLLGSLITEVFAEVTGI